MPTEQFAAYGNGGPMTDLQIKQVGERMIDPFIGHLVSHEGKKKVISYGLTSYGYDVRLAPTFKIFTNVHSSIVDPKGLDPDVFVAREADFCIIPPNSFILGASIERFDIPDNVICICLGKSTYARCGLIVNVTPLEPGWKGHITIEVSNTTPLPAKIYANEGIMQVLFFATPLRPRVTYATRQGKYQDQPAEPIPPRLLDIP